MHVASFWVVMATWKLATSTAEGTHYNYKHSYK